MRRDTLALAGAAGLAGMFGLLVAFGASGAAVIFIVIFGFLLTAWLGWVMRRPDDADWLPKWILLGFLAKVIGTLGRYWMVQYLYGAGDSLRYYRVGTELALQWRNGDIPPLVEGGAFGTRMVEWITGAIFALFTPDLLGGFLMFGILAFLGQLFFYAGFRRWARPHQLKPFAFLVLFLPTYAFWPSSIGKDALVTLTLGAVAYAVARVLIGYQLRWVLILGVGLVGLGLVRIHVAGLVVAALVGAALFSKMRPGTDLTARARRALVLVGAAAAAVAALTLIPNILGIELTGSEDVDPFTSEIVRRTSESGTVASGGAVTGPADIPGAVALVLFRPFIFEAREIQHLFAAAETSLLLGIFLWRLPSIVRHLREWRSNAYLVFCTFYVLGFAIAFSVIRNLGIIARQRGQVLALFIALVIGLGWEERSLAAQPRALTPTPARGVHP